MAYDISDIYGMLAVDNPDVLGQWITGVRKSLHMDRDGFAAFILRNPHTLGKWERGTTKPPYKDLKVLEAVVAALVGHGTISAEYLELYRLASLGIIDTAGMDRIVNELRRFTSAQEENTGNADIKRRSNH